MAGVHERRALKAGVECERVDIGRLYHQRRGICEICRESVPFDKFTVDHIRPLSKGGAHAAWNIQIAHASCNTRKNAKLPPHLA